MEQIPIVSIVGRQNVGKSSLLNALARKRISIVDPMPGVTRDRVSALITHGGKLFECVDTGGMGLDRLNAFSDKVEAQILKAIEQSKVVLFVTDVQAGLTSFDREIAAMLRRYSVPVVPVVNKADNDRFRAAAVEFADIGFGDPLPVSAVHRLGIPDLLDQIASRLPEGAAVAASTEPLKIAIVGKRNVGKSSFINALAGEERVIVSEIPGTTRDAVDVIIQKEGKVVTLIDTAGLRKKSKVADSVEFFSHVRTAEAILRADVVLFMVDVTEEITQIDKKIAKQIEMEYKPTVVVLNKWDKVGKIEATKFMQYISKTLPALAFAPASVTSALEGTNIWSTIEVAEDLAAQAATMVPTHRLNEAVEKAQRRRSLPLKGSRVAKIYYATQVDAKPPHLLLFVNDHRLFGADTRRFLLRVLQEELPFKEIPIHLSFRNREHVQLSKMKERARSKS